MYIHKDNIKQDNLDVTSLYLWQFPKLIFLFPNF